MNQLILKDRNLFFLSDSKSIMAKLFGVCLTLLIFASVGISLIYFIKPQSLPTIAINKSSSVKSKQVVNIDSVTRLAENALHSRQFQKAQEYSIVGLQYDSTSTNLLNTLATAYASQGRYALSIEALQRIIDLDPNSAIAHLNLGGIYTKLGKFNQAEINLVTASQLSPDQPEIHRRLGEVFLGTKKHKLARQHFSKALSLLPDTSTLFYYLGRTLEEAGKNDSALVAYTRAVSIDIGFAECNYRAAILARKLGRSDIAKYNMERFTYLGKIGSDNTDEIKKFKKLRASILNSPESFINHINMGRFFAYHDYIVEAENQFQIAIHISSESPKILNTIGNIYLHLKKPDNAREYYLRSTDLMPEHIPSILNIGVTFELTGNFEQALNFYKKAIKTSPNDPRCWYALGLANFNNGDIDEARDAWERTIELTPKSHPLRQEVKQRIVSLSPEK